MPEQAGDAVEKELRADEADPGMPRGLPGEMLAAAEADLEPDIGGRSWEQGREIEPLARPGRRDAQLRQEMGEQPLLAGSKTPAAPPSIELQPLGLFLSGHRHGRLDLAQTARSKGSTRSSFSQEKPPSGSGARPKWP
jgi:hypothetical protein